ncbi:2-phospho-L-lactate transferase [Leekyejoonella antrihumi]|uniref:2-phospho-L-lactate transferase n=1 Tax=Leekyejoonella antrihumi TaxID=1660198 RepID=A0A563DXY1_9MICO|nr:2-phospho-L-lactate transferase [Leekyejoonella antrihumi]TWP35087.1 2-phospho-L-lactate transferase [Leekyejoonella antrihumi]
MRITALAGGVGGARFLRGLRRHLDTLPDGPHELTIIGNTGDDITLFGLRVCPDLDTLLYTLGGGVHEQQGWGRADETFAVQHELAAYEVPPQWFGLGDQDFGTHIARSLWLGQGMPLSRVTARLAERWGLPGQHVRLLPMTDTPVETHVVVEEGEEQRAMHFQEWWVRYQAQLPAVRFVVAGMDHAVAGPGVLDAIRQADVVLLPPSNPVVSIGIILTVPGVRDALRGTNAPVVGVCPLVGGAPVRGHADVCLEAIGIDVTPAGVAGLYTDFLDGWLVDERDAGAPVAGLRVRACPLLMTDVDAAAAMGAAALELAMDLRKAA